VIIDSSALLAILLDEAERRDFVDIIATARSPQMSAASYVEVGLKLDRIETGLDRAVDVIIDTLGIEIVAFDRVQAREAREAAMRFGRGTPAKLNFGDCLVYGLAKTTGTPLLFKGNDFGQTDVTSATAQPRKIDQ
jgi:ribonuclease VapC